MVSATLRLGLTVALTTILTMLCLAHLAPPQVLRPISVEDRASAFCRGFGAGGQMSIPCATLLRPALAASETWGRDERSRRAACSPSRFPGSPGSPGLRSMPYLRPNTRPSAGGGKKKTGGRRPRRRLDETDSTSAVWGSMVINHARVPDRRPAAEPRLPRPASASGPVAPPPTGPDPRSRPPAAASVRPSRTP